MSVSCCGDVLVGLTPCLWYFWCPFIVATGFFGKYCLTNFAVNPGHVVYWLFSMAFIHVVGTGDPAAACKKCISSFWRRKSYALYACWEGSGGGAGAGSGCVWNLHSRLVLSRYPVATSGSVPSMMTLFFVTRTPSLVKTAVALSSHNWPTDARG